MHDKFNIGDKVRVISDYMGQNITDEIGTVVLIREIEDTAHPYGVLFEKVSGIRHDLFSSKHQIDGNGWPILKSEFYIDSGVWYRLKQQKSGYYFPERCLELIELTYDPNQQGDRDEDI